MARKAKVPPPLKKIPKLDNVVTGKIDDNTPVIQDSKNNIHGWSFIKPSTDS